MKKKVMEPKNYNSLLDRIANILVEARTKVVREINKAQVLAYWEIGREIVVFEQKGKLRAEYGQRLLIKLSEDSTQKFGKGFSVDNLQLMRKCCMTFPDKPMLSWSHYFELLKVEEPLGGSAILHYANITK